MRLSPVVNYIKICNIESVCSVTIDVYCLTSLFWSQFVLVNLDALGQTIRQVELLEMRSPRDPCDALLHDWAASTPDATVEHLLSMLKDMERLDVVMRLEDYIEGNKINEF